MTKKGKEFFKIDLHNIQSFLANKIDSGLNQHFHWKSLVAIIPIWMSIIYTLVNQKNNGTPTKYMSHNLKSFVSAAEEKSSSNLTGNSYKNFLNNLEEGKYYNPYQLLQFIQISNHNEKSIFSNSVVPKYNNTEKTIPSSSNSYSSRALPFFLSSIQPSTKIQKFNNNFVNETVDLSTIRNMKEPNSDLLENSKLGKIADLDANSIYSFLDSPSLWQNQQFLRKSSKNSYFKFLSGQEFLTKRSTEDQPQIRSSSFLNTTENEQNLDKFQFHLWTDFQFSPFIDENNNDIILDNPVLLKKVLTNFQLQQSLEESSFDFFGGFIKHRKPYYSLDRDLEINKNIFYRDLKPQYNILNEYDKDLGKKDRPNLKQSTAVRETENKFGDKLYTTVTANTYLEVFMNSEKIRSFNEKYATNIDHKALLLINIPPYIHIKDMKEIEDIESSRNNEFQNKHLTKIGSNQNVFFPGVNKESFRKDDEKIKNFLFFQYFPSIFTIKNENVLVVDVYQYLRNSYWLALNQLSICFFLISLLKEIYKNYQYELGSYLLEFASRLNLNNNEIQNLLEKVTKNQNLRIFRNLDTSFLDLGGMIELLPKFGETVWYLKNKCRPSTKSSFIPKAILLVGPPGTGKTLLVKAIGAEAKVPILIQSGNGILEETDGISQLQEAFQKAREFSPCILFIDEMDSIGSKRKDLQLSLNQNSSDFFTDFRFRPDSSPKEEKTQTSQQHSPQQINALTQLLVEMDGVQNRKGFVVFGATNRKESLDPALIRPGRFNDIIEIGLPNYQKRMDILKISTQKLGIQETIHWSHLAKGTVGLAAADLATLVNRSAIHSILRNERHTEESLLKGLKETKTTDQTQISINQAKIHSNFLIQLGYYEMGYKLGRQKLGKQTNLFENDFFHEDNLFRSFEYSKRESMAAEVKKKIQTFAPQNRDFILWIILELSGKASEHLFLKSLKQHHRMSTTIGEIDLFKANLLSEYLQNNISQTVQPNMNKTISVHDSGRNSDRNQKMDKEKFSNLVTRQVSDFPNKQLWNTTSLWLDFIGEAMRNPNWIHWFRIQIANPELTMLNDEILFPDIYQEKHRVNQNVTNQLSWTEMISSSNDLDIQNLLICCYQQSFYFLDTYRQELDRMVFLSLKTYYKKLS